MTLIQDCFYDVVVVGAGISGLGAASRLVEKGCQDIAIVEASDRIGGRIFSVPLGDAHIEMGACWVHGEGGNAVYEIGKSVGALVQKPYEMAMPNVRVHVKLGASFFFEDGSTLPDEVLDAVELISAMLMGGTREEEWLRTSSFGWASDHSGILTAAVSPPPGFETKGEEIDWR